MGLVSDIDRFKFLFEETERALEPHIIKLFRFLNEEKKTKKTRKELLEVIKGLASYMNIPENHEIYLLELYLLNYRKDGDYSSLTKENFIDPRDMKGKWTPNTLADKYTVAQLPFRGSNMEGYWSKDSKGVPYYIVYSYGWYPIYIFKQGRWYEITERYSSSTARQIRNANPVRWNDELSEEVFLLTRNEMDMLRGGKTHEDILKNKIQSLKSLENEFKNKRLSNVTRNSFRGWNEVEPQSGFKAKFKINSIDEIDGKIVVNVDVHDVLDLVNYKGVKTDKNYLKGELKGVTKEKVEKEIKSKLNGVMRPYIGPRYRYYEDLPESSLIKYHFNHLRK